MMALLAVVAGALVRAQLPATDDVPRLWPQPALTVPGKAGAAHLLLTKVNFQMVSYSTDTEPPSTDTREGRRVASFDHV